ncbi:hypothetical protein D3C76_1856290 [compost metagenome]
MLMLPMNINQPLPCFPEDGQVHELAVDTADALAMDAQLPADDQMLISSRC